MIAKRKRHLSLALLFTLSILVPGTWWLSSDRNAPAEQQLAAGSAPAGMERPDFIPLAAPGPVKPVAVNLADIAPGQFDPHNKYDRWLNGKVDFSKRHRLIDDERFNALKAAAALLPPSLDVQVADDAIGPTAPSTTGGFDSLDYTQCCGGGGNVPPDPELAAGPNHLIAVVNVAFRIYDKSGNPQIDPTTFSSFMGVNPSCTNVFDPNALYDEQAGRYILAVATSGGFYCVAVSDDSDPMGTWYIYAFQGASGAEFFDYPHAGVGQDAIYVGANIFGVASFKEGRVFALDKTAMYAGQAAGFVVRGLGSGFDTPQPLNLHGVAQGTWPDSGPHYFFADKNFNGRTYAVISWDDPFGDNVLTEAGVVDLNAATGVMAGMPLNVPQASGGTVDGGDWRPQDFEYRNGYGWTVMTIACNPGGGGGSVNCVRWAQIDLTTTPPSVADAGVYASNGTYRSYADLAANDCGDMAVGYTKSDASMFPSIWYTGRLAGDSDGVLQAETQLKAGEVFYTSFEPNAPRRWGDYTGMTIDPDGTTFWYLGEYSKNTGTTNGRWGTYIGSFSYGSCGGGGVTVPAVPTGFSATEDAAVSGNVNLLWTDNADDEDGYRVFRDGSPIASLVADSGGYTNTGVSDGTHEYYVQAYNAAGAVNSSTATVTLNNNPGATLHIADLDGTATSSGPNWQAVVTATVRDNNLSPVMGALVMGKWTGDYSGPANCASTTDVNGTCVVTSGNIPKRQANNAVFAVTGITHASLAYQSADNVDPDGDSSGTAIQVNKDGTTQDPSTLPNQPPVAAFTFDCGDPSTVNCTFNSSGSFDPDPGDGIASYAWAFGDSGTSTLANPSHDYIGTGSYSVSLTVTDNSGATGNDTQTVPAGITVENMHVGNLDGRSGPGRRTDRWDVTVTIEMHGGDESLVDGATVSGSWGGVAKGSGSCITVAGQCDVTKGNLKRSTEDATFTVSDVTHASLSYDSGGNDVGTFISVSSQTN